METQAIKAVLKPLERIAGRGYHISSVFRDWVSLMLYSLAKEEDLYMETMGRYRNELPKGEREADLFAIAFSELHNQMAKINHDLLGDVYMEIAGNYSTKGMGQFFTPIGMCDAMASLTLGDESGDQPKSVADPACGSCRTLISAAKNLHFDSTFHGIDADSVCTHMGALNCTFFNMNAVIIHGNSLDMKFYDGWITTGSLVWGGRVRKMSDEELELNREKIGRGLKEHQEVKEVAAKPEKEPGKQFVLFE